MQTAARSAATKLSATLACLAYVTGVIAENYEQTGVVFVILGILSCLFIVRSWARPGDLIPFVLGAILGPTMEMILIHAGAWEYATRTFGGIPAWLPLLWGLTAVALCKMSHWLHLLAQR
jgi:hypothetical protein